MPITDFQARAILRTLSHALRHHPERYLLELDAEGWADLGSVLSALRFGRPGWWSLQLEDLKRLVESDVSGRFEMTGERIRTPYGHSIPGVVAGVPTEPPDVLYHGTDADRLADVRVAGLQPMGRQHVHLTSDYEYARTVADSKMGRAVVLEIQAKKAFEAGVLLLPANHHVWLAETVPSDFITFPDQSLT